MFPQIETVHRNQQIIPERERPSCSLSVTNSRLHGLGCFATLAFLTGNRIAEYVGEKISRKEAMQRMNGPNGKRISELEAEWYIDGSVGGTRRST